MHAPVADLWSGFVDIYLCLVLMHSEVPLVPRIAVDPRQNLHAGSNPDVINHGDN